MLFSTSKVCQNTCMPATSSTTKNPWVLSCFMICIHVIPVVDQVLKQCRQQMQTNKTISRHNSFMVNSSLKIQCTQDVEGSSHSHLCNYIMQYAHSESLVQCSAHVQPLSGHLGPGTWEPDGPSEWEVIENRKLSSRKGTRGTAQRESDEWDAWNK